MKKIMLTFLLVSFFISGQVLAAEEKTQQKSLEEKLDDLNMPSNTLPNNITEEDLYSVQSRYSKLTNRHEFLISGGRNLNIDGHLESNQLGLGYRYHINGKWAVGINAISVDNDLSDSGQILLSERNVLPETDYVESQIDVVAEYNLFYGKFRFGLDTVLYFDQYISAGVSQITLNSGDVTGGTFDAGFAFWLDKWGSLRLGIKNDFYNESTLDGGSNFNHNAIGYLSFGYLFGGN